MFMLLHAYVDGHFGLCMHMFMGMDYLVYVCTCLYEWMIIHILMLIMQDDMNI